MPNLPELERKHGVKNVEIHVMLGAHKIVIVMDPPSFEAAEMVMLESRLISWNTIQLSQSYDPQEAMRLTRPE